MRSRFCVIFKFPFRCWITVCFNFCWQPRMFWSFPYHALVNKGGKKLNLSSRYKVSNMKNIFGLVNNRKAILFPHFWVSPSWGHRFISIHLRHCKLVLLGTWCRWFCWNLILLPFDSDDSYVKLLAVDSPSSHCITADCQPNLFNSELATVFNWKRLFN